MDINNLSDFEEYLIRLEKRSVDGEYKHLITDIRTSEESRNLGEGYVYLSGLLIKQWGEKSEQQNMLDFAIHTTILTSGMQPKPGLLQVLIQKIRKKLKAH